MPKLDSKHLRYFVAVAEELNFRKAAARLSLAQPALTRQIKALESHLKITLLERDKHHVALTPAGRVMLEKAQKILKDLDDLTYATQRAAHGEIGTLRVGFISFVAYEYLPAILKAFRSKFPDVGIELHEFPIMKQFQLLLDGNIDVAFLTLLSPDRRILTKTIVQARFVVALPLGHPLLRKTTVKMRDLAGEDFVTLPKRQGPNFHEQIMSFCSRAGFMPKVVREASDGRAVIGLVAAGMGVAIVAEPVTKLNTSGVEYRQLDDVLEHAEIAVAWRSGDGSEVLKHFVNIASTTQLP